MKHKEPKLSVSFECPVALRDEMNRYAALADVSRSWLIRSAVQRLISETPTPVRETAVPRLRDRDGSWDGAEL